MEHKQYNLEPEEKNPNLPMGQDFTSSPNVTRTDKTLVIKDFYIANDNEFINKRGQKVGRLAIDTRVTGAVYSSAAQDYLIGLTHLSYAPIIGLPKPSLAGIGKVYLVKDEVGGATTTTITIVSDGEKLIDGATSATISANYDSKGFYTDGANWFSFMASGVPYLGATDDVDLGTNSLVTDEVRTNDATTPSNLSVNTGDATSGDNSGGILNITTGNGSGTGNGGAFNVNGGTGGASGTGGSLTFNAGNGHPSGGGGGAVTFGAGSAQAGDNAGGDLTFSVGSGTGSGADGRFVFAGNSSDGSSAELNFDGLTTTDKTFTFPNTSGTIALTSDVSGDWQQLGETTLGSGATSVSVSSFSARKDLRIVAYIIGGADSACQPWVTFNSDTGSNYSTRRSVNGAADATDTSSAKIDFLGATESKHYQLIMDITNLSANRKFVRWSYVSDNNDTGVTSAPYRAEGAGMWGNTSAQITTVTVTSGGGSNFGTGSRVTVYGKKD